MIEGIVLRRLHYSFLLGLFVSLSSATVVEAQDPPEADHLEAWRTWLRHASRAWRLPVFREPERVQAVMEPSAAIVRADSTALLVDSRGGVVVAVDAIRGQILTTLGPESWPARGFHPHFINLHPAGTVWITDHLGRVMELPQPPLRPGNVSPSLVLRVDRYVQGTCQDKTGLVFHTHGGTAPELLRRYDWSAGGVGEVTPVMSPVYDAHPLRQYLLTQTELSCTGGGGFAVAWNRTPIVSFLNGTGEPQFTLEFTKSADSAVATASRDAIVTVDDILSVRGGLAVKNLRRLSRNVVVVQLGNYVEPPFRDSSSDDRSWYTVLVDSETAEWLEVGPLPYLILSWSDSVQGVIASAFRPWPGFEGWFAPNRPARPPEQ